MNAQRPEISIVVPIYNEEGILLSAVHDLLARLPDLGRRFEIILAENGSKDNTVQIAAEISTQHPEVSSFSASEPNYGLALREGIARAQGDYVICDEVDICDVDFYRRSIALLDRGEADLVVGSKTMPGARDKRPLGRLAATYVINRLLRLLVGFRGTDTHGLKAFRANKLRKVASACVVDRDLFASEFVIRAGNDHDIKVVEIPVSIAEKRPPSIYLVRRVPAVLKGLGRLFVAIRLGR